MKNTFTLSEVLALACVLVHFDEYVGSTHYVDLETARAGLRSPVVATILAELQTAGLLPLRRDGVCYE